MTAKSLFLLLALAPAVSAKPIVLAERLAADDCFQVQLKMSLTGAFTFRKDGKQQSMQERVSHIHLLGELGNAINDLDYGSV